jgi:hypothetical protein
MKVLVNNWTIILFTFCKTLSFMIPIKLKNFVFNNKSMGLGM